MKIPYSKPSISTVEIDAVADAVANGWGEYCYDYIAKFEELFAMQVGAKYAIATSSCTGALQLGLAASGIGAGDEVILADLNWIATAAPILHANATPVFGDIEMRSWCLDPVSAEKLITKKTRAIIVTHLYGNVADIARFRELAKSYDLLLIEDAAEAIGSYFEDKHVGVFGDFSVFSFHGTKTITAGEGGMFVTNSKTLADRVSKLNNHGRKKEEQRMFWSDEVGYKFKMSNLQAALGFAQTTRFNELVSRKRSIFEYYWSLFSTIPYMEMNPYCENKRNGFWMPTIFWNQKKICRDVFLGALADAHIDGRPTFWPLSGLGVFPGDQRPQNKAAFFQSRSVNLPSFHDITPSQQKRVFDCVFSAVERLKL